MKGRPKRKCPRCGKWVKPGRYFYYCRHCGKYFNPRERKWKPPGFGGRNAHTPGCWDNRDVKAEYICYCPCSSDRDLHTKHGSMDWRMMMERKRRR